MQKDWAQAKTSMKLVGGLLFLTHPVCYADKHIPLTLFYTHSEGGLVISRVCLYIYGRKGKQVQKWPYRGAHISDVLIMNVHST